jgi:ketosteroid isomerase-like protein
MTNGEIVKGIYDAFAAGDVPGVVGAMDPLINWTEADGFLYGGTYIGPDAILENVLMKYGTEWDGFSAIAGLFVEDGNTVVAVGSYGGKYLKTGQSMDVPFAHVWTLRDGKIVRFVQHTDTLLMARMLGLE